MYSDVITFTRLKLRKNLVTARCEAVLSIFLLFIGFVFRLRQYLYNRSLWLDEALLANNVVNKSFRCLFLDVLDSQQAAPPLFLFASKTVINIFGTSDIWLRLVPFFSGVVLLASAYYAARILFLSPISRLAFLALVSSAPVLIYYASEFKQYGFDAAVTLVLLTIAVYYKKWRHGRWIFAMGGAVLIWFSHPAVFVLAAVGVVEVSAATISRDRPNIFHSMIMAEAWLASFVVLFYISALRETAMSGFLQHYWAAGYAPFPPTSINELGWYPLHLLELITISFKQQGPVPFGLTSGHAGLTNIMLITVILGGVAFLWQKSNLICSLIVGPIATTLVASAPGLYPFTSRMILFLVPISLVLYCSGVDWLASQRQKFWRFSALLLAAFAVGGCFSISFPILIKPYHQSDIKSCLIFLRDNYQTEDVLAISVWSKSAYKFYAKQFELEDLPVQVVIGIHNDKDEFLLDLSAISRSERVWTLFSHRFSEGLKLVSRLKENFPLLLSWEGNGSGIYLWAISNACQE